MKLKTLLTLSLMSIAGTAFADQVPFSLSILQQADKAQKINKLLITTNRDIDMTYGKVIQNETQVETEKIVKINRREQAEYNIDDDIKGKIIDIVRRQDSDLKGQLAYDLYVSFDKRCKEKYCSFVFTNVKAGNNRKNRKEKVYLDLFYLRQVPTRVGYGIMSVTGVTQYNYVRGLGDINTLVKANTVESIADYGDYDNMIKYGTILEIDKEYIDELRTQSYEYQGW